MTIVEWACIPIGIESQLARESAHIEDSWGPLHMSIDERTREAWGLLKSDYMSSCEQHPEEPVKDGLAEEGDG
jgi:hypothetical protein